MNSIDYSDNFEDLLKQEAEKAESMSILHNKAHQKYNRFSVFINAPVIIFSGVVGFLSPISLFNGQAILLGSISLFISILKAFESYFDWTKRAECHRMTSLNYIRISKWIQIQLSLERDCRVTARDLLDIISNELQNIRDAEPQIPNNVIKEFNLKYKDEDTAKPAITNGLTSIKINKNNLVEKKTDFSIQVNIDNHLNEINDNLSEVSKKETVKEKDKPKWKP
jgi:hypothetical protein